MTIASDRADNTTSKPASTMPADHTALPPATAPLRELSPLDGLLTEIGRALEVLGRAAQPGRPNPAAKLPRDHEDTLSEQEARHAAGLMRVNHVGEICAQALYRGQAGFCPDPAIRQLLYQAAAEEVDHLAWCDERLKELNERPSLFNPFWYGASFALGLIASRAGVGYNLGFMAETERQVEQHLDQHLQSLPQQDQRSRAIVAQMKEDEMGHRHTAEEQGAKPLPMPVRFAMRLMSKVMTTTAYRL